MPLPRLRSLVSLFLLSTSLQAQVVLFDSLDVIEMDQVVVTGTKSARPLANVPVATTLITAREIEDLGALRLSDLLSEQLGLSLFRDQHGTGLQVQGFDADYTLILIDGEPVIGRTAGTLDLERLSVSNIERVEIVRGPSSSLYGSEALAGVVNLITKTASAPFDATFQTRLETHDTFDLTGDLELKSGRWGSRIFLDRLRSDGYDLLPDQFGSTAPAFTQYTADARLSFEQNRSSTWNLGLRWSTEEQTAAFRVLNAGDELEYDDLATRTDWSVAPSLMHRFSPRVKMTAKAYGARFLTDQVSSESAGGEVYFQDRFDQGYGKAEVQFDVLANDRHFTTLGGGFLQERILGDRYESKARHTSTTFLYAQDEWVPGSEWDVVASARLDYHTEYRLRLTPKLAVLYKPTDAWRFRGSVGSGFKAPDFRQLYLNFTNALAGYNVFGSAEVERGIERLQADGQILEILVPPSTLDVIRAEHSWAYNVAVETDALSDVSIKVNLFRNNVRDLIEWLPVATKTNGQNVFSYTNLNRIYTQGIESELTVQPLEGLKLGVGYQRLDARDLDVLEQIDSGRIYKRENGRDRLVTRSDYGGLMSRSKHSGTVSVRYRDETRGLSASLRGVIRGRYGYRDNNGNLILDDDSEYVPGYSVWNLTLTKSLFERLELQAGANNLFDYTNPARIPSLPGRLVFAGLRVAM